MKCIVCHQSEAYVAEDVTASVSDFVREARKSAPAVLIRDFAPAPA